MTTELFDGTPAELKIRLDAIIGGAATINIVVKVAGGTYLIIYT
jgi:hypothetical protein